MFFVLQSALASGRILPRGAKTFLGDNMKDESNFKLMYSPDGTRLAVVNKTVVLLYDTVTYENIAMLSGHADRIHSVAFSPDSRLFASASWDIRLWDVQTGEHIQTLTGHPARVHSITFSPDSKTLASASWDIRLWNTDTGKHRVTLTGHEGNLYSTVIAFSPDGKTLASGGRNSNIRLWDVQTGKHRATLTERIDMVSSIEFHLMDASSLQI